MNSKIENIVKYEHIYDPEKYIKVLLLLIQSIIEEEKTELDNQVMENLDILKKFLMEQNQIEEIIKGMEKKQTEISKETSNKNHEVDLDELRKDYDILLDEIKKKQDLIGYYKEIGMTINKYINLPINYLRKSKRLKVALIIFKVGLFILGLALAFLTGFYFTERLADIVNITTPEYSKYIASLIIYLIEVIVIDKLVSKLELSFKWKLISKIKDIISEFDTEISIIKEEDA